MNGYFRLIWGFGQTVDSGDESNFGCSGDHDGVVQLITKQPAAAEDVGERFSDLECGAKMSKWTHPAIDLLMTASALSRNPFA
jgi:hypothetical protein